MIKSFVKKSLQKTNHFGKKKGAILYAFNVPPDVPYPPHPSFPRLSAHTGLAEEMVQSCEEFLLRIWIIDNRCVAVCCSVVQQCCSSIRSVHVGFDKRSLTLGSYVAVCSSVLYCAVVCCSVLQCVLQCVLQRVAVCCSVL